MSILTPHANQALEILRSVRRDPIEFLKCVRTLDEVDTATPVKPFPIDLDYIRLFCKLWLRERFIAVPKSRRMKMTWTCVALFTWDAMFHAGRHEGFVSKKEDDSNELLKRSKFILDNLDPERLPRELIPAYSDKYCEIAFPELNSKISGFASGSDQLRQFTLSGILADEMAFWKDAQAMYSGSMPTLQGGGRFTAISSAGPGFFKHLVHDTLDQFGRDGDEVVA
jgi:hypothetical protein